MWQVPVLLLATAAAVCQDPARETLQTATVIDYVTSLGTAVLMQIYCAVDWTIPHKVIQQCILIYREVNFNELTFITYFAGTVFTFNCSKFNSSENTYWANYVQ